ncbi:Hypothetical predicted protein [Olea europaea subsp. europaea]|uniref:Uncharacterized protein n=1 Tax=Olea europaea subsp. europaea TaxID=158383 RepID=A0A8S0TDH8_OLEEU|nr:Hypothetical predicted protein [Olea europaea subsp. europaea]
MIDRWILISLSMIQAVMEALHLVGLVRVNKKTTNLSLHHCINTLQTSNEDTTTIGDHIPVTKTPHNNALHRSDLHTVCVAGGGDTLSVADGGDTVSVVDGGDIVSVTEGAPTVIGDPNHSCEATVSVDMSSGGVVVNCFHGAIVVDVFAGVRELENIEREGGERPQIGCGVW